MFIILTVIIKILIIIKKKVVFYNFNLEIRSLIANSVCYNFKED